MPFTRTEAESHQAAWAKHLGLSVEFENSIGMKFRVIPPGQFLMGSSKQEVEAEAKLGTDRDLPIWYFNFLQYEAPQHQVTLTQPFGMGIYEVTRGQFRRIKGVRRIKVRSLCCTHPLVPLENELVVGLGDAWWIQG